MSANKERYQVRVTKDHLVFCAGHFISYSGHQCERLHGHNYRAAVEVEGTLSDTDYYVYDFVALKRQTKVITDQLDHHMLLATRNPVISVVKADQSVKVTYKDRRWEFPVEDCVLLPIENTTAELLAKYICHELLAIMAKESQYQPSVIRVEVEENVGQSATYEFIP